MVKTRMDLKIKIREFIVNKNEPFTTKEVANYAKIQAPNLFTSVNRIAKFIKANKEVIYDKETRKWQLQPNVHVNSEKKTEKSIMST